jgi:hypothetical protein
MLVQSSQKPGFQKLVRLFSLGSMLLTTDLNFWSIDLEQRCTTAIFKHELSLITSSGIRKVS